MKIFKKLSLLLIFTLGISLFSGCTQEDKALLDAFMKNQEILSSEGTMDLSFSLSATGLTEEEQISFDNIANLLNNLTITMVQKAQVNKEQTEVKGQIDATIKLPDMSFDSSIWVEMDMAEEEPVFKEIFKLPSILTASMPELFDGKEYLVLDFNTMNDVYDDMDVSIDYNEVMSIAMKYQDKFVTAIKDYISKYDSELEIVTKLEDKVIDGETCNVYQVKFDNATFKQFLKYSIISFLEDETILPLFEEYMTEIFGLYGETMPEEIDFKELIPELIPKITGFFNAIENLNILGEEGITIEYAIGKDGYIISEVVSMDFVIDTQKIMDLFTSLLGQDQVLPETSAPIINFTFNYDSKVKNINKDIEVIIPEVTEENSIDFVSLMTSMMPSPESRPVIIIAQDNYVELSQEPMFINNRVHIPVRDVSKAIDAEVAWNQSTKEVTILKDDIKLILKADSDIAIVNNEEVALDSKITISAGTTFVPLRFISETFGYNVEWDSQARLITINK